MGLDFFFPEFEFPPVGGPLGRSKGGKRGVIWPRSFSLGGGSGTGGQIKGVYTPFFEYGGSPVLAPPHISGGSQRVCDKIASTRGCKSSSHGAVTHTGFRHKEYPIWVLGVHHASTSK